MEGRGLAEDSIFVYFYLTGRVRCFSTAVSPKHLGYGIASGVGNIVCAAVGTAGILVLAPTAGLGVGLAQGGILGGAVGLVGGEITNILLHLRDAVYHYIEA
jgi:hypothetical protein